MSQRHFTLGRALALGWLAATAALTACTDPPAELGASTAAVSDPLVTAIDDARRAGRARVHARARRDSVPAIEAWAGWAPGFTAVAYQGERAWILSLDVTGRDSAADLVASVRRSFAATELALPAPADKAPTAFLDGRVPGDARDPLTGGARIQVILHPDAVDPVATLAPFALGAAPASEAPQVWALVIDPADAGALAAQDDVHAFEPVPVPLPLMEPARFDTGSDKVQGAMSSSTPPSYSGWTGRGVRMSNNEGLDTNHDDFWNHDSLGARTTARWTSCGPGTAHGTMTAGIMLGNGWRSSAVGVSRYRYRGLAPEATFTCPTGADIRNASFTSTWGAYGTSEASVDNAVRTGIIAVGAVANQGITAQYGVEVGYYSPYRVAKNEIIVANLAFGDYQWNRSSIGPTWDGRLKPDLAAPGGGTTMPRHLNGGVRFELDWVQAGPTASPLNWSFNGAVAGWAGGWGNPSGTAACNVTAPTQITEVALQALRTELVPLPWGSGWCNGPLIGTTVRPDGVPLAITGAAGDKVKIRYRLSNLPTWAASRFYLQWSNTAISTGTQTRAFPVVANGQWQTALIDVGSDPNWVGVTGIQWLVVRIAGGEMLAPLLGNNDYNRTGGSSASSPVVAGAVAQLVEQVHARFGAVIGDHTNPSPYRFGGAGTGMPLPSTFKALLLHTARDLAYIPRLLESNNPDTGVPTVYHKGPDLVTGYGALDVGEASRVIDADWAATATDYVVERPFTASGAHTYSITVPAGQRTPLKVTLAWDDPAGATTGSAIVPRLVNDLDLKLTAPGGGVIYPYSINPPYLPSGPAQYPGAIEPEPILPSSIHAARQDLPNHADNVEQVVVEFPQAGVWTVTVNPTAVALLPQVYSIVLGTPPRPAPNLAGGKVVFSSNRVSPQQIFVQPVGAVTAPVQLTSGAFTARHPQWSPNGAYVAYVTSNGTSDVLMVVDGASGVVKGSYPGPAVFGNTGLGYPAWSPDGKRIAITAYDTWGVRAIKTLNFTSAYSWGSWTASVLVPPGVAASALDPGAPVYSPDGGFLYFTADSDTTAGGQFQIPAGGGTPFRLFGDASATWRGYHASVAPGSRKLVFNSEAWRDGAPGYVDEEAVELDLSTGVYTRLTQEPGHQTASYAINAVDLEVVIHGNTVVGGNQDLFLQQHGVRVPLYIADPSNLFDDSYARWYKAPPPIVIEEEEK